MVSPNLINTGSGNGLMPDGITRTNADFSLVWSCDIHMRAISYEMLKISILDKSMRIINLRSQPHLPGANEFIIYNSVQMFPYCKKQKVRYWSI